MMQLMQSEPKPMGYLPTWGMVVGLPALAAGVSTYAVTRSRSTAVWSAAGGALGGALFGLFIRTGRRPDF